MFLIANPTFVVKQLCNQLHNKKTACVLLKSKVRSGVGSGEKGNGLSLLILSNKTQTSLGVDHVSVIDNIIHIPFSEEKNVYWHDGSLQWHYMFHLLDCDKFVLAKPVIKEFRELDRHCVNYLQDYLSCCFGFGYDPKSNVYKVIQFPSWICNSGLIRPPEYRFLESTQRHRCKIFCLEL